MATWTSPMSYWTKFQPEPALRETAAQLGLGSLIKIELSSWHRSMPSRILPRYQIMQLLNADAPATT